jgi:E1A/CREB-binding protein
LGLIDKLVTGPLWRIIEKVPSSLSLNTHLYQLKLNLENWSKDATAVLVRKCVFYEDLVSVTKDCIYESLVAPAEDALLDTYTQMALEICFSAMLIILERQCKDQLPGGKYWDLEPATIDKLLTVPTTNTVSERDFAQLDVLMRTKPSASTTTFESIIMWTNNKHLTGKIPNRLIRNSQFLTIQDCMFLT